MLSAVKSLKNRIEAMIAATDLGENPPALLRCVRKNAQSYG